MLYTSVAQLENATQHSGWLQKEASGSHEFRAYWFVLAHMALKEPDLTGDGSSSAAAT
eukprot:COSAG01_NODE_23823_length_800_cov_1.733238_2_plen_57_part_01